MQWSCSRVPPPAAAPDKADRSAMAMLRSAVGLALRRSPPSRLFATSGLAPRLPPPAAPAAASRFFSNSSRTGSSCTVDKSTEETKEDLYPRRMHSHHSPVKIRIVMKSFNNQNDNLRGLAPYTQKIGLPESRSLYTVLRSPHIDKKSREQFSTHVKKLFVVKKAETHELQKKFFWLKRLRILGAQYEIYISFKTRLDNKIGCSKGGGLLRQ